MTIQLLNNNRQIIQFYINYKKIFWAWKINFHYSNLFILSMDVSLNPKAIAKLIARYQFCHNGFEEKEGFVSDHADLENTPHIPWQWFINSPRITNRTQNYHWIYSYNNIYIDRRFKLSAKYLSPPAKAHPSGRRRRTLRRNSSENYKLLHTDWITFKNKCILTKKVSSTTSL